MQIYDVIIVGAGPVGLATAIGLRQRGIVNVLVVDQAREFRRVGQSVDVLPNGLKALKYLAQPAYEEVKKAAGITTQSEDSSQPSPKWFVRDLAGQKIRSIAINYSEWLQKYSEGRLNITWFDLQTTLRNLIPQEQVKANHRCINIVYEENEYVRVDCLSDVTVENNPYAHWNSEANNTQIQAQKINTNIESAAQKSFRGKLVVAADGINSTVRKLLYQNTAYETFSRPEYSGYAAIICSGNNVADNTQTEIQEKFLQNSPIVTITQDAKLSNACEQTPRMMLLSRKPGEFRYLIHIPVALNKLQENSLIDVTLQQLENNNFPNAIKELVRTSNPANMQHRTYYIHRATVSDSLQFPNTANLHTEDNSKNIQPPWHLGRVVLAGDAAHGMPPFAAQGVNQGFEDALAIVELINIATLDNIKAIQEAFNKYENLRRPLMEYVQKITMTGLDYSSDKEELDNYNQHIFGRNLEKMVVV